MAAVYCVMLWIVGMCITHTCIFGCAIFGHGFTSYRIKFLVVFTDYCDCFKQAVFAKQAFFWYTSAAYVSYAGTIDFVGSK